MAAARSQMHLNAFIYDIGHHEAAWRLPESDPFAPFSIDHYVHVTRIAEAAGFDSIFFADVPAVSGDPRYRPQGALDPTTLLASLAMTSERIGLIATASTTYSEPYDLARRFASIDHISHGRAGWNIVTSATAEAAANFGHDEQPPHRVRYERAEDFVQAATKLWDSWDDDALVADKEAGVFARGDGIHPVDHRGPYFRVAGPLNVPRSPQGRPLLVQAGSSSDGRAFAARWAEAVFTAQRSLASGQEFYADVKRLAVAAGRRPQDVRILPGIVPVIGATEAEARAREAEFERRIVPAYGLRQLSQFCGVDLTGVQLDAPLPQLPAIDEVESHRSRAALISELAQGERLTVRQLLGRMGGGRGHRTFAGTPEQLADDLERWFSEGAADGFNVMAPALPGDLERFIDQVLPILRARGLVRTEYEGTTLREHYGLQRPPGRYARRVVKRAA
jgi:N-acetyl-S-(2-succino)cysteine monooxygenase